MSACTIICYLFIQVKDLYPYPKMEGAGLKLEVGGAKRTNQNLILIWVY